MTGNFIDEKAYYQAKEQRDPQTRFWNSSHGRDRRFDAILRHTAIAGQSVVDLGCGAGDLLQHAVASGAVPARYDGLDIVESFVAEGLARGLPGRFHSCDVLEDEWPVGQADWIIANGIFALAQAGDGWWTRYRRLSDKMWRQAKTGMAYTIISTNSPKRNEETRYCDPGEILNEAIARFGDAVLLDHSYLPNDFLLVVRKTR
ncbi:MAG: class I SAM-dependent methyltransferase [Rhodospirillaceae bacterium]|jgi:cyclopropane fatty-acyl-phospholipid synthase-like methyltransferase|nr:class I SAM-dependent methyltransferase [Rhodospirillaceae bacterium]MBT6118970.1 class I SAM-dependent methyltransferase [Rhodospirillaceae bacterium]